MTSLSFQDQMPGNKCWGCGPNNKNGLQIKSYWNSDVENESIMTWKPAYYHKGGSDHTLNGGIISTLIDCHSICTAIAQTAKNENVAISDKIWYVTGMLEVKYLKPTPIEQPVKLTAHIVEQKGKKTIIKCSLWSNGTETVQGEVIGIRVFENWGDKLSH